MKTLMLLTSLSLLFNGCTSLNKIKRPFTDSRISITEEHRLPSVSNEQVNSGQDVQHRVRAKELGLLYVDYLHLINNGKLHAIESEPTLYHKYPR
jgi:hypothetical protein